MEPRTPAGGEEFSFSPPAAEPVSRRLISIVVAVALLAAAGGYVVLRMTRSAEAQVFRYSFTEGETATYELSMDMKARPTGIPDAPESLDVSVRASMDLSVVDVMEDGSSVIEIDMRNVQVTPNPGGGLPPDLGKVRVTIAPDGRITNVDGLGGLFSIAGADPGSFLGLPGGGTDGASSQFIFPQYPSDAIAPGDKWSESQTFPFPFGDDEITVKLDGRHDGFEDTAYGRAARIHHHIDFPMDIEFTITELFDAMLRFAEEFGDGSAPVEPPPAALRDAKMIFSGGTVMDSDSLVLPDGDFVQMDGTGTMSFQMRFEGVPESELAGAPSEFQMDAEFDMSIVRVDSARPT